MFDELYEPHDPLKDPRVVIKKDLIEQLGAKLSGTGIEVVGGGISNLEAVDSGIIERRIQSWRAEWEREIMSMIGEGRAKAIVETERAHARAQADMIAAIRDIVQQHKGVDPNVIADMAALRFIEALEEMACQPQVKEALPAETMETMAYLRRALT
jgi:hypothetical protein